MKARLNSTRVHFPWPSGMQRGAEMGKKGIDQDYILKRLAKKSGKWDKFPTVNIFLRKREAAAGNFSGVSYLPSKDALFYNEHFIHEGVHSMIRRFSCDIVTDRIFGWLLWNYDNFDSILSFKLSGLPDGNALRFGQR